MPCVKRMLIAAAGLLLVAGCANNPQTAAHVGDKEISANDVEILGKALCFERVSSGQAPPTSMSAVRGSALAALIDSAVDAEVAKTRHLPYDAVQLGTSVQRLDPLIAQLPSGDQDRARELITDLLRGQMQLSQAAVAVLQQSGQKPTQQLVTQAMQQLETSHAEQMKITINPAFTSSGIGYAGDGAQSVSRAVSTTARDALSAFSGTPSTSYIADLPATQKCG